MLKVASSLPRLPLRSSICLSKMSTTAAPRIPKFTPVEQSEITSTSKPDGSKFRLVSYNILAQAYAKSEQFPHSPSPCRRWKTRSRAILNLLKSLKPEFFCLQEVDEYDSFYEGNMESHGYASIYIQRSGKKPDGCGIFYKRDNAELILEEKIEYNDLVNSVQDGTSLWVDKDKDALASGNKDTEHLSLRLAELVLEEKIKRNDLVNSILDKTTSCVDKDTEQKDGTFLSCLQQQVTDRRHGDPNDPRVRLKRDCVGIMGAFKLKDPSHHVVILANTHLYWDPNWADVKLAQAKYLMARLAEFRTLVSDKFECSPSVFVAGDFNSTPGDKVYQYLISGSSSMGSAQECLEDLPIPLCSVYALTRGEPPFTNCTPGFTGTLDYIFFSPSGDIKPVSYLEIPGPGSPDVIGGLPNYHHPSDHLPIGAEFEVVGN
ncbi:carbon catabolite repressor protein 4 homolog 4 isoform X1 [Actinidia eriantha]|uniref:carbon catabolite repressor protein 4 homolog 4 isoform X1 n=1 Tax=Actinidia eriantha TaxID=165200 RepID=UPI00258A8004|nr:carbon catabolite repressor protein 4 homolog 4 isoform X1 [Actinidia eriantha]XP_057479044.1 carbon catabolite repressor protein 4 homolog 4 isoform X1 [Actinidia eriantha]